MGKQEALLSREPESVSVWASAIVAMSEEIPAAWDPIGRSVDYTYRRPDIIESNFSLGDSASRPPREVHPAAKRRQRA